MSLGMLVNFSFLQSFSTYIIIFFSLKLLLHVQILYIKSPPFSFFLCCYGFFFLAIMHVFLSFFFLDPIKKISFPVSCFPLFLLNKSHQLGNSSQFCGGAQGRKDDLRKHFRHFGFSSKYTASEKISYKV